MGSKAASNSAGWAKILLNASSRSISTSNSRRTEDWDDNVEGTDAAFIVIGFELEATSEMPMVPLLLKTKVDEDEEEDNVAREENPISLGRREEAMMGSMSTRSNRAAALTASQDAAPEADPTKDAGMGDQPSAEAVPMYRALGP